MERKNTTKTMSWHGFTQFDLSKKILNNLSQFNLKPTTKLVLLYLCDCYNPKHGEMFPKQSTIAAKLGVSEVSVTRAIQELHKEGLVISERKYINRYRFTSKIGFLHVEKCHNNMIEETNQKDTKQSIKKTSHVIEQKKELNKPTNVEDYKILRDYAISKGAKNINAYVLVLQKNGSAEQIIKQHKTKLFISKRAQNEINSTKKQIEELKALNKTAITPFESVAMQEVKRKFTIKKSPAGSISKRER